MAITGMSIVPLMIMITNKPAIRIDDLSFSRADNTIFTNLSLDIPQGQHVALLGTNGSGKSTLLDLITGIAQPDRGTIVRGEDRFAFVPQRSALKEHIPMTAWDTVAMGRWGSRAFWKRATKRDRDIIHEKMELLEVTDLAHKQLSQLSGGQKQRILIAGALAQDAPLILLDEPESGLDTHAQAIIRTALSRESATGTTILIATHDLDSAKVSDRCILLKGGGGGIVADGTPDAVLTDHTLALAFH